MIENFDDGLPEYEETEEYADLPEELQEFFSEIRLDISSLQTTVAIGRRKSGLTGWFLKSCKA